MKRVLIVAGEASADLHGAHVVKRLKRSYPEVELFGLGGERMVKEGFVALARAEEVSVMGLTEVIRALPRIWRIARHLVADARRSPPVAALLLDLPDFNLRLARRLKALGVPVIYYISPQVWAWRKRRVRQIARVVDRMLVILPFEEEFYRQHGVEARFVGHPLLEELGVASAEQAVAVPSRFRDLALAPQEAEPVVALLPGSRGGEVERHLPVLLAAAAKVRAAIPQVRFLLPIASAALRARIEAHVRGCDVPLELCDQGASQAVIRADAAAVCSGTASLQTALLGVPLVVFYRVSWLTYCFYRLLVRVGSISLVNLIAEKKIITELIQADFTASRLAGELIELLTNSDRRGVMSEALAVLRARLGKRVASEEVAAVIANYLRMDDMNVPE